MTIPVFTEFDWAKTPLGPQAAWSPALSTTYDIMQSAHVAMCATWGPNQTFFYNAAYVPFLGDRHPAALGRPIREVWPDVWGEIEPLIARAMAGERIHFTNHRLVMTRHEQEEETYWDFSYSALREGETVQGFLNVTTETTHNVVSERRQRAVFDSAVDVAIITTDRDGGVTGWNTGAERIFGWTAGETVDQPADRIFTPEDRTAGRVGEEMAEALQDGKASDERWHIKNDGSRFWASGELMPLRDAAGAHLGYTKIVRDRTAAHMAGLALEEAEDRLRRAQEIGGIGLFTVDMVTDVMAPTPEFCRLYGLPVGTSYPSAAFEDLVIAEDRHLVSTAQTRADGRLIRDVEYRIRRPDNGTERWIARRGEIEHGEDGKALRFTGAARDVTAQKHASEALAQSEARFRTIIDTVDAAFAIVQVKFDADDRPVDYRFIEANPAFERQAGVNLRGKWVTEFAPDLERFWFDTYGRVALTGEPATFENYAEAFRRWFDVRAVRVGDPAARQIAILFSDVTARHQLHSRNAATQALSDCLRDQTEPRAIAAAMAEILGTALQASLVGYGTVDAVAGTITVEQDWAVPEVKSLPSVIRSRDYGQHFDDLLRAETVVIADVARDPRTEAFAAELEAIGARAFVNVPVFKHEQFVGLLYVGQTKPRAWTDDEVAFLQDVAERMRAALEQVQGQKDLRASEAVARENIERVQLALAAGAIIGTWHWDLPSDRFTVDEAFARSFGLDPALGREGIPLAQIVATVHPDDQTGLAAAISEAIARGGPYAHQYRVRRADGHYYWLEANGRVDHAPDGTPLSFPGVLLDIEERRAVEAERARANEQLRSLNETLEQRVTERTHKLMEAEEQLRQSQKMEAVGQLTGGVAHDFNNLLTIIRSSVDFLRRPELPEVRKLRYLDAVSETVDRAAKLTGQLLAFARRQALKPEVFDVGAKLRGVGDMLDTVTGARVRVSIEVPDHPCYVRADLSQFETALINMAVNARDAMDGEGSLALRLESAVLLPAIRGHAGSHTAFAAVTVSDTGSGIPEDQLARIFEPFFTTKEVGKGTGLGLSQVFGFAKQSGGDVDVRSAMGEGTAFTLYLPQEQVEAADLPAVEVDPLLSPAGAGQRVLVVEDNIEVGRFCTQILEDLGYVPFWAANAEAALEQLGADGGGFDVVFSDVVMPGMGGVALAQTLRKRLPDLPVVLASGYSHVLAREADHGFELLHKPYSAEQLARVLQRMTAKSPMARQRRSAGE